MTDLHLKHNGPTICPLDGSNLDGSIISKPKLLTIHESHTLNFPLKPPASTSISSKLKKKLHILPTASKTAPPRSATFETFVVKFVAALDEKGMSLSEVKSKLADPIDMATVATARDLSNMRDALKNNRFVLNCNLKHMKSVIFHKHPMRIPD